MPLDEQVARYLEARTGRNLPPTHTQTPDQHRQFLDNGPFPEGPRDGLQVTDETFNAAGREIAVRIYRPLATPAPAPVLLFMHGGGWVCGNLDSIDGTMRRLSLPSGVAIVSVRYRRAPEDKFPAALDDAAAALDWVEQEALTLGFDPARLAVGGASAGGNLAAALALRERDQGRTRLVHQLLVYPCLDHACDTPSYVENATGYVLTAEGMKWYWNHYLSSPEIGDQPYASPLRAESLAGLPPAHILTAEYDPLRDEAARFAGRLSSAGVEVTYAEYAGMVHGFFNQWHMIDRGLDAIADAARFLADRMFAGRR